MLISKYLDINCVVYSGGERPSKGCVKLLKGLAINAGYTIVNMLFRLMRLEVERFWYLG